MARDNDVQLIRHYLGLRDFAYSYAMSGLGRELTEDRLVKIARKLFAHGINEQIGADRLIDAISEQGNGKKLACRSGCAFCCMQQTSGCAPEIFAARRQMIDTMDKPTFEATVSRMREYDKLWKQHRSVNRERIFRRMCPLNQEGKCQIYDNRPAACRGFTSFDVNMCEQLYSAANEDVQVLGSKVHEAIVLHYRVGLQLALNSKGLAFPTYDYVSALLHTIDHPESIDEYLAGKDPFESYALPVAPNWVESNIRVSPLPITG